MKKWIQTIAWLLCVAMVLCACQTGTGDPEPTTTGQGGGANSPIPTQNTDTTPQTTIPEETTLPATTPPETVPSETTVPETTPGETEPEATQPSGSSRPGGTGGFEGGSTGGPSNGEAPQLEVPEVGGDANPFAEAVLALPDSFATVAIPAGGKVSYRISGLAGNVLTIADPDAYVVLNGTTYEAQEGVVSLTVPASQEAAPVLLQLGNQGAEEKELTLTVTAPVGSQSNPQVLDAIDAIDVKFAAGQSQYFCTWTAPESGKLTLVSGAVTPEGAVATIVLTCGETSGTTDETGTSIELITGEVVTICVTLIPAGEGAASLTGSFEASAGSLSNPISIPSVDVPYEATVPGESTVYFSGYLHEMTMSMLNYEDVLLLIGDEQIGLDGDGNIIYTFPVADGMGRPMPIVFGLTNTCDTQATYSLTFTYPLGSPMNPAQMVLGENTAQIRADNADGYTYVWIVSEEGKLVLTMAGSNWQYTLNNLTQGIYGEIQDASLEPSAATVTLAVKAGDEISVNVNGFTPEDPWSLPGGTVSFTAEFSQKEGTWENPIGVFDLSQPFTTAIPAGESLYYTGRIFDVDMLVENATGLELTCGADDAYDENGVLTYHFQPSASMGRPEPIVFCLTNATEEDATYTLQFIYPLGTPQNPAELILGENTATVNAGNTDGYIYNWTATADGELTVTMAGDAWSYVVNNLTSGTYGDSHTSSDDPLVASETVQVTEGQQLQIIVNTFDPNSYATPAGSVTFTASMLEPDLGMESNPIEIMGDFPVVTPELQPGQSIYYDVYGCNGMLLACDASFTVNGQAYNGAVMNVGRGEALRLVVTNDTEVPTSFTVDFSYPKGHPENPAQMVIGNNRGGKVEAGNESGYNYIWTAEENGLLTIAIKGMTQWQYQINNETAGVYGDLHLSDEDPQVPSQTLQVTAGDVVRLMVNTYDPADPWNTPAGNIGFAVSFVKAGSTKQVPIEIHGQFPIVTGTMAPEQTLYYTVYNCNGMVISTDALITVNGQPYNGEAISTMRGEGIDLVVYNQSAEDKTFTLEFAAPKGSFMNPAKLNIGENTASLAAGNSEGYLYKWTASADGTLVIAMKSGAWQYVLSNESTGAVGDLLDSTDPVNAIATLAVKKGQVISLNVNAFDPADPYSYPGGKVGFVASFYESEMAVKTLASGTESGKELTLASGALENGGRAYLAIASVTEKATGKAAAYTVNGEKADGGEMAVFSVSAETQWAIAREGGSEIEVSYAVIYVYEIVPAPAGEEETDIAEPETIEPETIEPETTEPETTEPETIEPEATKPTEPEEIPQPEEIEPEGTLAQ